MQRIRETTDPDQEHQWNYVPQQTMGRTSSPSAPTHKAQKQSWAILQDFNSRRVCKSPLGTHQCSEGQKRQVYVTRCTVPSTRLSLGLEDGETDEITDAGETRRCSGAGFGLGYSAVFQHPALFSLKIFVSKGSRVDNLHLRSPRSASDCSVDIHFPSISKQRGNEWYLAFSWVILKRKSIMFG